MAKRKREATSKETEENSYGCHPTADIPHEVLLQILQKLCVKTLMKFTCVSKLWFDSISNDPRFIEAHFLESQKKPLLLFNFLPKTLGDIENTWAYQTKNLYYLQKDEFVIGSEKVLPDVHKLTVSQNNDRELIVGNCNGLVCFLVGGNPVVIVRRNWSYFVIEIVNFSKLEKLRIVSRIQNPGTERVLRCQFGYDCLSNKYKLMCLLSDFFGKKHKCLILTLGCSHTQLWRDIKNPPIPEGYKTLYIHCINGALYWWLCDKGYSKRGLLSFDLHEEKFQVIESPQELFSKDRHLQFEYGKCLCVARIKESDTHGGVVDLNILIDRIKQVWVKETITFDLPVTVCPSTIHSNTCTISSLCENTPNIDSIRIIEFTGKVFLYWGKSLVHKKRSRIIQFYDLQLRELTQVRVGITCGSSYRVTNHVENLISLRAWATKDGDGGGELGRNYDKNTVRMIEDMFKQMPSSPSAAFIFFSSLR